MPHYDTIEQPDKPAHNQTASQIAMDHSRIQRKYESLQAALRRTTHMLERHVAEDRPTFAAKCREEIERTKQDITMIEAEAKRKGVNLT